MLLVATRHPQNQLPYVPNKPNGQAIRLLRATNTYGMVQLIPKQVFILIQSLLKQDVIILLH